MSESVDMHDAESIDDLAAGWLARQRAGDMTPDETARMDAWIEADPAHRASLDALHRAWDRAELARHDPEILAWRERALQKKSWRRGLVARALAACLAVALIGGGGAWMVSQSGLLTGYWRFSDQAFHTDFGQRATFTLPDGTEVTLNTDSRLRTRAEGGRRLVFLDRGQAYFKVAKDPAHPFVVTAAGRTITALGTAFDVRVDRGRFEVTLVEGKIRVEAPAKRAAPARPGEPAPPPVVQTTELAAGSQLVSSEERGWSVRAADTVRETSWLSGRLTFEDEPLSAIAAEFGRYSERKIVLAEPAVGEVRVTGTFRSGDVDGFVRALEKYRLARVEGETELAVTLGRY